MLFPDNSALSRVKQKSKASYLSQDKAIPNWPRNRDFLSSSAKTKVVEWKVSKQSNPWLLQSFETPIS